MIAKSRQKNAAALRHFVEATRRDPDFLAAWTEIIALSGSGSDPLDQDAAVKAILRLDPGGRHSARDFSSVRSTKALYEAIADARKVFTEEEPQPLLALDGSKAAMDKFAADNPFAFGLRRGAFRMNPNVFYGYPNSEPLPKPGTAVAGQAVASGAIALFEIDLQQRRQAAMNNP
jgi:hypothetical protein